MSHGTFRRSQPEMLSQLPLRIGAQDNIENGAEAEPEGETDAAPRATARGNQDQYGQKRQPSDANHPGERPQCRAKMAAAVYGAPHADPDDGVKNRDQERHSAGQQKQQQ